jgi:hypothetical protein
MGFTKLSFKMLEKVSHCLNFHSSKLPVSTKTGMFKTTRCPEMEFLIEVRTSERVCTTVYRKNVIVRISIWKGREKTCYKYEGICL